MSKECLALANCCVALACYVQCKHMNGIYGIEYVLFTLCQMLYVMCVVLYISALKKKEDVLLKMRIKCESW